MLDNGLVLWGNELGAGNTHTYKNIPWGIAGSAGGYFKTGRQMNYATSRTTLCSSPCATPTKVPLVHLDQRFVHMFARSVHSRSDPSSGSFFWSRSELFPYRRSSERAREARKWPTV